MQPFRLSYIISDVSFLFCDRELYFCLERPKKKERSHTLPWQQTDQASGGQPGWWWYHANGKFTWGVQVYFVFRPHFPLLLVKAKKNVSPKKLFLGFFCKENLPEFLINFLYVPFPIICLNLRYQVDFFSISKVKFQMLTHVSAISLKTRRFSADRKYVTHSRLSGKHSLGHPDPLLPCIRSVLLVRSWYLFFVEFQIACISPSSYVVQDTLNTLRYAHRAKRIKNKPVVQMVSLCQPYKFLLTDRTDVLWY